MRNSFVCLYTLAVLPSLVVMLVAVGVVESADGGLTLVLVSACINGVVAIDCSTVPMVACVIASFNSAAEV